MSIQFCDGDLHAFFEIRNIDTADGKILIADDLRWHIFIDLVQTGTVGIHFCNKEIRRRHICDRQTVFVTVEKDAHNIIVLGLVQRHSIHIGARCYDTGHGTLYHALGFFWILDLFADSHFITSLYQACQIGLCCVIWHATHGSTFLKPTTFSGQSQFQFLGYDLSILKEHFIEITQTIKQDTVRIGILSLYVMLHHGR